MIKVFIQFSDATESKIIATFSCPQDFGVYLNQGEIDVFDPRYTAFLNPSATKNSELLVLAEAYRSDLQTLQSAWVSVLIADGALEDSRKSEIALDIADLKSQYLSDVSAVKLKYSL